jgi:hypothetical protein
MLNNFAGRSCSGLRAEVLMDDAQETRQDSFGFRMIVYRMYAKEAPEKEG